MNGFQEGEGVGPLLRQIQVHDHAGVVGAQHLGLGVGDLRIGVIDLPLILVIQRHIALFLLLIDKEDHIHGGYGIAVDAAHDGAVVILLIRCIGGVEDAGFLVGKTHHLRELPGRQLVGEEVAGLGLHIGKTHGIIHLIQSAQLLQNGLFTGGVPLGDHQCHDILGAEFLFHPVRRCLMLIAANGHDGVVAIHIGALVGEEEASHHTHDEYGHAHMTQGIDQLAPAVDLGDEVLVAGPLHRLGEQHQQSGHQGEHGQHTQQDGLNEHQTQVKADAELHEHHGGQTGNGSQAAGGDRGNGGADSDDAGRPVIRGVFPLFQKAVKQDDGVVDGQRKLEHHCHRVGHEGDLAEDEVGALVQQRRRHKGQQQHRHLGVGTGGQQQHQHDDQRGHH